MTVMLRILCLLLASSFAPLVAQGTFADYQRADEQLVKWRRAGGGFDPEIHWLSDGGLWFRTRRDGQREFVRVDTNGKIKRAASMKELGVRKESVKLRPWRQRPASSNSSRRASVTFENALKRPIRLFWLRRRGSPEAFGTIDPGKRRTISTYVGHSWIADYAKDDVVGVFVAEKGDCLAVFDEQSRKVATTTPPKKPLRVRSNDVWLRVEGGDAKRLTDDGTAEDGYQTPRYYSPDGSMALGFRVAKGQKHHVHIVESSPRDQLQPKLHTMQYRKPGDRIDQPRPVLFDVANGRRIDVDEKPFDNAWSINRVHWADDGSEVYCLYNRRGHQLLRIYAINAKTGKVRTVLEEKSDTFVDYSQKTYLHWCADGKRLLWTSERDGWNHIYEVTIATGALRQLTSGEWVVRRVERVDELGRIWFTALGLHKGQDPYYAHLARVDRDGRNPTLLTHADGYHEWEFSPDGEFFVARWSRVDHPWVTEYRRAKDGELLAVLGRDDRSQLLALGFVPPERFVAKGRDGKTDIHGIVIKPSSFDPSRSYPVIEDIYAGPHSHFVPKKWGLGLRQRKLAELGFIVVRIDGMGTNWRSRAFHDVCWRNLKDSGFPDRIAWLQAAAKSRTYMDLERVGIFGGSAGGQSALAALLHHGDFYDAAVSDCGCHDNRMDKIWWNEAWLGWPVGPWYADSSNVTHAAKLRGKLFLTVGERDTNVDPASTMQVVDALIRARKDFDLVVVPGGGHGVGETPYLVRRRQDFFVRHLLGAEPRRR